MPVIITQHQIRTKDTLSSPSNRFNPLCLNTGVTRQVFKGFNMKKIPLTQNQVSLVDDEDFDKLNKFKWYADKQLSGFYARRMSYQNVRKCIHMSHVIINCPKGKQVDHINHDTLDNRKDNLRVCSNRENSINRRMLSNNKTGYRGVVWHKRDKKFASQIKNKGKHYHLGSYDCKHEAALVYNRKAKELHGKYAFQNKIPVSLLRKLMEIKP